MTARSRLACLLVVALAVALPACTNLTLWVPVDSGAGADADHAIQVDGVMVEVNEFGVLDGWGKPTADLRIRNESGKPATFDLAAIRLAIDDERFAPTLEAGQTSQITVQQHESFDTQITFDTTLPIQQRDGTNPDQMQVLTQEMTLHLAPLFIGGTEHVLPALAYRNPDP